MKTLNFYSSEWLQQTKEQFAVSIAVASVQAESNQVSSKSMQLFVESDFCMVHQRFEFGIQEELGNERSGRVA